MRFDIAKVSGKNIYEKMNINNEPTGLNHLPFQGSSLKRKMVRLDQPPPWP